MFDGFHGRVAGTHHEKRLHTSGAGGVEFGGNVT